eukprot:TRINITY_DN46927_c0_g3_i1.p1 TRINITY_DN46927_c0_g3~~TRINITY_DN46927_c0_g3_i1.p1  ORF type:complete len:270 (-),score=74.74 TRINITY_DN46927_c0_g3_i1:45-854(-)
MPRGPKKHLKRLNAPKHWMLDKLTGIFAPRPSTGPHGLSECLPIILLIRNRLKYALTRKEVQSIAMQRHIRVDGKVRTDINFPAGFMDVVSIPATSEHFRLLYDVKGRFAIHRITDEEAKYKLGKVKRKLIGPNSIPFIVTHDGRTIRYPDPEIALGDSIRYEVGTGKILEFAKNEVGNLCMITGGTSLGRVGVIEKKEKHPGSFDIVHIKDAAGKKFSTRSDNVFIIGKGTTSLVSLPARKGIKLSILEEREARLKKKKTGAAPEATA